MIAPVPPSKWKRDYSAEMRESIPRAFRKLIPDEDARQKVVTLVLGAVDDAYAEGYRDGLRAAEKRNAT